MKKTTLILLVMLFAAAGLVFAGGSQESASSAAPDKIFATIGTGGVTGVYYPTGGAISKMVNAKFDTYHIKLTVESTGGSVFNVNALMSGDLEFGVIQSDRQFQGVNGTADWKDKGPQKKLRAICAIHPESVTLLAAVDANINSIEDLKGKVVNIGNPGSGQRQNAIDALENAGISWENDLQAESLKADEAAKMLQDGRLDAYFYTVGHPAGSFKEATAGRRKVKFIPIVNLDNLLKKFPYYAKSFIPVSNYPMAENSEDVPTFGVKATLCTSADVPDDIVYAVTKEIFDNLDAFKKLHPAFAVLTKENMLEGLSAPIADGAMKYYKEAGLK